MAGKWAGGKWDYKKIEVGNDDVVHALGVAGEDGWELVAVSLGGTRWMLLLKRPRSAS